MFEVFVAKVRRAPPPPPPCPYAELGRGWYWHVRMYSTYKALLDRLQRKHVFFIDFDCTNGTKPTGTHVWSGWWSSQCIFWSDNSSVRSYQSVICPLVFRQHFTFSFQAKTVQEWAQVLLFKTGRSVCGLVGERERQSLRSDSEAFPVPFPAAACEFVLSDLQNRCRKEAK